MCVLDDGDGLHFMCKLVRMETGADGNMMPGEGAWVGCIFLGNARILMIKKEHFHTTVYHMMQ